MQQNEKHNKNRSFLNPISHFLFPLLSSGLDKSVCFQMIHTHKGSQPARLKWRLKRREKASKQNVGQEKVGIRRKERKK